MISKAETVKKIRNFREAKALVEKYREITEGDLSRERNRIRDMHVTLIQVLHNITGFGGTSCMLCRHDRSKNTGKLYCESCIYILAEGVEAKEIERDDSNSVYCVEQPTFKAIRDFGMLYADRKEKAVEIIRARADYIERLIEIAIENGAEKSQFE